MRYEGLLGILWLVMTAALPALEPKEIAILYNSADPESKELAEFYAEARNIPQGNLIGLEMPKAAEISREQYDSRIAAPLRQVFKDRNWLKLGRYSEGVVGPVRNQIRVLLTMRGVPLKISITPLPEGQVRPDRKQQPYKGHDEASVDSELAMFGVSKYPLEGAQRNRYFKMERAFTEANLPGVMLTCRIDAPTLATCKRMIQDAIEVEKTGLWGFHQVDIANKFPQGDGWLKSVIKQNRTLGIPTGVDRFAQTLPTHYPLKDIACYYGWYDWNLSGPMLNPSFRMRRGSVAIHIHSYSAQQLRNPKQNWSGGLLEAGAAATVGNVYEPFLALTHHLDILHDRLLKGHTWVEASWMALPVVSWQAITLGDPLYRPFAHLDGGGKVLDADREYRALCTAMEQWRDDPKERIVKLKNAAIRMNSGIFLEAIALESIEDNNTNRAGTLFIQARELYSDKSDQLRQDLHRVAMVRRMGNQSLAADNLKRMIAEYQGVPEVAAAKAWLKQIVPPVDPPEEK